MTAGNSAARDGHNPRADAVDLSSVFGAAAASSARRFGPRRPKEASKADEPTVAGSDVPEPETTERVQDRRGGRTPAPARPARAEGTSRIARHAAAPTPPRRPRVVKVRDRQHVDMLLLAAATKGPADGRELIDLVRKRSGGLFVLSVSTVYRELHRLTNNRLMQVAWNGGARRYQLTSFGERVLATQRREWEAFSHGLERVLEAADDGDYS
jgi:DNA-binding PadR family transcriptional regulator